MWIEEKTCGLKRKTCGLKRKTRGLERKTRGLNKKREDSKNSSASIEKQNDEILRRFVEKCVDS